jgi:hypothetical protein
MAGRRPTSQLPESTHSGLSRVAAEASPVGLLDRHRVATLANLRLLREDGLAAITPHEVFMEIFTILVVLGLRASTRGLA